MTNRAMILLFTTLFFSAQVYPVLTAKHLDIRSIAGERGKTVSVERAKESDRIR